MPHRCLALALALALALTATAPTQGPDPRATDLDKKVMAAFEGRFESPRALVFYDPARVTEAQRDAAVADIAAGFDELERVFGMAYEGRILAFLYGDGDHLRQLTGSGAVAFSTGTVSLHQPHDFRGVHELTHLFAMQFPREPHSVTDMFVVEGLATILAKVDQGVDIQDWAAICAKAGRLPDLLELRKTFPEGAPEGVHPYHVAGSFVGYLIERFGMEKVLGFYGNTTEAQHWFGAPVRALEFEWRQWLLDREVAQQARSHVLSRFGLSTRSVPGEVIDADDARELVVPASARSPFRTDHPGVWSTAPGSPPMLVGKHTGSWSHATSSESFGKRVAIRARLRLDEGNAIKIWCGGPDQPNEAIFASWATYLSSGRGFAQAGPCRIVPGAWNDVVLVHDGAHVTLLLNGIEIARTEDVASPAEGSVGIAVEKGSVTVSRFSVVEW